MEHIALIERGIDKWPKSLVAKSEQRDKYFDKHNLSLWRTALEADGRRHVRAMKVKVVKEVKVVVMVVMMVVIGDSGESGGGSSGW
jgi:hypothetical protein